MSFMHFTSNNSLSPPSNSSIFSNTTDIITAATTSTTTITSSESNSIPVSPPTPTVAASSTTSAHSPSNSKNMTSSCARDIITAKNRLNAVLGSHSQMYWDTLKRYSTAHISKGELDNVARTLLGDKIALHNDFVKAIIQNASADVPALGAQDAAIRKKSPKRNAVSKSEMSLQHVKLPYEPSLPDSYFQRNKGYTSDRLVSSDSASLVRLPMELSTASALPTNVREAHAYQKGVMDNKAAFRAKIFAIAFDYGLQDVSSESTNLLYHALEIKMKDFIEACALWKQRLNSKPTLKALKLLSNSNAERNIEVIEVNRGSNVIDMDLLHTVISLRPDILGENQLMRHKVGMKLK